MITNPLTTSVRALLILSVAASSQGFATELGNTPLITSAALTTVPNLLFVLDDSGSMAWTHMPDDATDAGSSVTFSYGYYGLRSSQCNGIYYNPDIAYQPPVYADGTSYPNATFTSAESNGYDTSSSNVNLGTNFRAEDDSSGTAAYYYRYTGTQTTPAQKDYNSTTNDFYKECHSSKDASPGNAVFTKVTIGDSEKQNFANWYSYYRTRMLTMKTAAGRAFRAIDSHYRVGFMAINNNESPDFLNFATFDTAQKSAWYAKLYGASASGSTPLGQALSNAGRIYAGKLTSLYGRTVSDPIQYACQQNFTILSTDGFWNIATTYNLSGNTVGQQDGTEPRPYNDGAISSYVITTPYTTVQQRQTITSGAATTNIWSKTATTLGGSCSITVSYPANAGDSASHLMGLGTRGSNATNPDSSRCVAIGTSSSSNHPWFCRGSGTSVPVSPIRNASVTDASGVTWYLVNSIPDPTKCISARTAFGSSYSADVGACQGSVTSGTRVTTTPYTQTETISGATTTVVKEYTANQSTTQTVNNGVAAPTSALTPAPPTYSFTRDVSTIDTPATTDICGGQPAPCPSNSGTWTAGAATSQCITALPLPTAETTTPTLGSSSSTPGTTSAATVLSTVGPTAGMPTTSATSTTGGTANTLADVAEYYYMTDLRTDALGNCTSAAGDDVCDNIVPVGGRDAASWQHMTTFTLGFGARGRMIFSPTYLVDTSGDYADVKNGRTANPPTVCSWQAAGSGACNWPAPGMKNSTDGKIENIDDVWHAAVNGRGTYFSAGDPASLATGLSNALAGASARLGSAAAAATSNPNVSSGDNYVFSSTFTTQDWDGEVIRQQLDLSTGDLSDTVDWRAQTQLDAKTWTTRTIYTYDSSTSNHLKAFLWDNLNTTEKTYFNSSALSALSQFCSTDATCLSAASQTSAAGANLVNFLRGERTNEGPVIEPGKYYHQRTHLLGDIVSSEAVFVRGCLFRYTDTGYGTFKTAKADRQAMLYLGANDGMLHAFNADTGNENWAYVPALVLPRLYKLADKNYANLHSYFVDGSPTRGDVYFDGAWHTILVAGLNGGGRGYYALDITDPASPKAMWEFTDTNLGYTYGNPIITKLKSGAWVVLVTSGYNNVTTGDGIGRLYVLNAATGAIIRQIATSSGSTDTPSGLARINAWVDNAEFDNTALRVYGGDELGNLWRFDINGDVGASGYDAQLLAKLKDAGGNAQPITAKPELGDVGGNAVILVGTGRFLGNSDLTDVSQQSFYAIKDTLSPSTTPGTAIYDNPRATGLNFIRQTETVTTCPANTPPTICSAGQSVRTTSHNVVDFGTNNGWYIDFPVAGERANTDPTLALGTLVFTTNKPDSSACMAGGYSNLFNLDYRTGSSVSSSTTGVVAKIIGNAFATRPTVVQLPNGTLRALTRLSDGTTVVSDIAIGFGSSVTRGVSWREIVTDQ